VDYRAASEGDQSSDFASKPTDSQVLWLVSHAVVHAAEYPASIGTIAPVAHLRVASSITNRRGPQYGRDGRNSNTTASTEAGI